MANGHGGSREGSGRPKGATKDPALCRKERLTLNCTTEEIYPTSALFLTLSEEVKLAKLKGMSVSTLVVSELSKYFKDLEG